MIYIATTKLESRQKKNKEKSGDNEKIDIKIKGEGNATNENNKNAIETNYPFIFQIALDLKKMFFKKIDYLGKFSR